jgi:hypothetical protein
MYKIFLSIYPTAVVADLTWVGGAYVCRFDGNHKNQGEKKRKEEGGGSNI